MKQHGWTILELVVVAAIVVILFVKVVPAFESGLRKNQALNLAQLIKQQVSFSRELLHKSKFDIVMCASADSDIEIPSCSRDNDWSTGWIIFKNKDSLTNTVTEFNSGDAIVQRQQVIQGLKVRSNQIMFNFIRKSGGSTSGSFFVCTPSENIHLGKKVIVSSALGGRVRIDNFNSSDVC